MRNEVAEVMDIILGGPEGFTDELVLALSKELAVEGQGDPWLDSGDSGWSGVDRVICEFLKVAVRNGVKESSKHLVFLLIHLEQEEPFGQMRSFYSAAAVRALDTYQLIEEWRRVRSVDVGDDGYLPPEKSRPPVLPLSLDDFLLYDHSRSQILGMLGGELNRRGIPIPKE